MCDVFANAERLRVPRNTGTEAVIERLAFATLACPDRHLGAPSSSANLSDQPPSPAPSHPGATVENPETRVEVMWANSKLSFSCAWSSSQSIQTVPPAAIETTPWSDISVSLP